MQDCSGETIGDKDLLKKQLRRKFIDNKLTVSPIQGRLYDNQTDVT